MQANTVRRNGLPDVFSPMEGETSSGNVVYHDLNQWDRFRLGLGYGIVSGCVSRNTTVTQAIPRPPWLGTRLVRLTSQTSV